VSTILFVCNRYHPYVGGIETFLTEFGARLIGEGFHVKVLTRRCPEGLPSFEEYRGIQIWRVGTCAGEDTKSATEGQLMELVREVNDSLETLRADVIHVVGIRKPLPLFALMLSRLWRVPLIVTPGGGDLPDAENPLAIQVWSSGRDLVEPVLREAECVTAFSRYSAGVLKSVTTGMRRMRVVYAGIDTSFFRDAPPFPSDDPYILSLRRLDDPSKGVDLLVEAFNLITARYPRLRLWIAGTGREETRLRRLVEAHGLAPFVRFLGNVTLAKAASLLKSAELTVVPSRSEAGGLVNIEAQAAGCPVVASRVGGIPEYVREGVSALLFESGNYHDLAGTMTRILDDGALRDCLVENGYEFARAFDWEHLDAQYLYEYALAQSASNSATPFRPWSETALRLWTALGGR